MQAVLCFVVFLAVSASAEKDLTQGSLQTGKAAVLAFTADQQEVGSGFDPGAKVGKSLSDSRVTELTQKILEDISTVGDKSLTDVPHDTISIQEAETSLLSDLHRVEDRIKSRFPIPIQFEVQQSAKESASPSNALDRLKGAVSRLGHGIATEFPRFFLLDKHSETSPDEQATVNGCGEPTSMTWLTMFQDNKASVGVFVVVAVYLALSVLAVPVLYYNGTCRVLQIRSPWCICASAVVGMNAMLLVALPHMMSSVSPATVQRCLHALHFFGLPLLVSLQLLRVRRFRALYRYECDKLQLGGKQPILSRLLKGAQAAAAAAADGAQQQEGGEQGSLDGMVDQKRELTEQHCLSHFVYLALAFSLYTLLWCTWWSCKLSGPGVAVVTGLHDAALFVLLVYKVLPMSRVVESFGFKRELYLFNTLCGSLVALEFVMFFADRRSKENGSRYNFMLFPEYHIVAAMSISLLSQLPIIAALNHWWRSMRDMYLNSKHDSQKMLSSFADFDTVMYFPAYRKYFFLYLSSEFLSEYALFWRDVKEFRKLAIADDKVSEAARAMYDMYIQEDGALCLMLDDDQRVRIAHALFSSQQRAVGVNAFQVAEDAVYQRMCALLPRFIQSPFARVCAYQLVQNPSQAVPH